MKSNVGQKSRRSGKTLQAQKSRAPFRILITGGGCVEPIDDVRAITNSSTGKTALQIARREVIEDVEDIFEEDTEFSNDDEALAAMGFYDTPDELE